MLPLFYSADPERPMIWHEGRVISLAQLADDVAALARRLPAQRDPVNLCERRYAFIVTFCAALLRGQSNLLPSSRAPDVVSEVLAASPGSYRCDDESVQRAVEVERPRGDDAGSICRATLAANHVAALTFTSGSTGVPTGHIKRWGHFLRSAPLNAAAIRECIAPKYGRARPWLVATVPPQHMYGLETSVLLPLAADMAVHTGRPFFPADVVAALADVPAPRVLVTTPVHLRALLASGQHFPEISVVVSATAPLAAPLAISVEREWQTRVLEIFGSTETGVIATRLTAQEEGWRLHRGIALGSQEENQEDGPHVDAPWFESPVVLQDRLEWLGDGRFLLRGRHLDMIEVAGKRASLADLTRRLLSVPGVEDAVIFQPDVLGPAGVRRVAALVVAPSLTVAAIHEQLMRSVDPVFIPRPLLIVPILPRNELGKLPRERLLTALKSNSPDERRS